MSPELFKKGVELAEIANKINNSESNFTISVEFSHHNDINITIYENRYVVQYMRIDEGLLKEWNVLNKLKELCGERGLNIEPYLVD